MPNAKDTQGARPAHKVYLLGDTGSGKTTQFLTFPGKKFAYLFDPNAILSLRGQDVDYEEFMPDRLNISVRPLSNKVTPDKTTNHQSKTFVEFEKDFDNKLNTGFFDPYDSIMFDSGTTLLGLIMDRVLTLNGRAGSWPQQDDYGPQMNVFQNICRTLTSLGKTVLMTGHLDMKKDELTGRIFRNPMVTGQLRTKLPLLFSDIFICEVENDGQGNMKHKIQTVPDRITTCVRTTVKGLQPFEDVTLDWKKPLEGQGVGGILKRGV